MVSRGLILLLFSVSVYAVNEADLQQLYSNAPKVTNPSKAQSDMSKLPGFDLGKQKQQYGSILSDFDGGLEEARDDNDPISASMSRNVTQYNQSTDGKIKLSIGDIKNVMSKKNAWRKPSDSDPVFQGYKRVEEGNVLEGEGFVQGVQDKTKPKWKTRPSHKSNKIEVVEKTCIEAAMPVERKQQLSLHLEIDYKPAQKKVIKFSYVNLVGGSFAVDLVNGSFLYGVYTSGHGPHSGNNYISNPLGDWAKEPTLELTYLGGKNGNFNSWSSYHPYATYPSKGNNYILRVSSPYQIGGYLWDCSNNNLLSWKAYIPPKIKVKNESWVATDAALADLARQGICKQATETCVEGAATRNINGVSIHRPCWKKEITYHCGGNSDANECAELEKQGCTQIASQPHKTVGDFVVEFQQKFRCGGDAYGDRVKLAVSPEEIVDVNKVPEDYESFSGEGFGEAMVQFHVLKEMARALEDGLGGVRGDEPNPTVFHGSIFGCRKVAGSGIKDCCNFSGILGSFCSKYAKTKQAVMGGRCHALGEYCVHKDIVTGSCFEKKKNFSCFGSKMARLIQEIARDDPNQTELRAAGFNADWGTAKEPNSNLSLTAENMSMIDFGTPFARHHMAELLREQEEKAKEKMDNIQQFSKDKMQGFEARAKKAMGDLEQHIGNVQKEKGVRPTSKFRGER